MIAIYDERHLMSGDISSLPNKYKENLLKQDDVASALDKFTAIKNHILFLGLKYSPYAILIFSVEEAIRSQYPLAEYPIYYTGLLSSALSLILFSMLMERIPYTLGMLWNREILADKAEASSDYNTNGSALNSSNPSKLENNYLIFINEFEELLNNPCQWAISVAFALLVFAWHSYKYEDPTQIAEHLIAFVIGLMAWRMIIIGIKVRELGIKFDIHPQLGHPDGCGGLEPLGNLCLWNALILSILGVFLGGWILLMPYIRLLMPHAHYGDEYINNLEILYYELLLIPVSWACVSFFLPLLSIHKVLLAKRDEVRLQLNQLGQRIDQLSHDILTRCHELDPDESEKMTRKLEILQQTYQQNKNYPVWPFNADIIKKLTLSQTVQLLSLTGLGKPILSGVQFIISHLNGLSK